jgi:hypothetical protein
MCYLTGGSAVGLSFLVGDQNISIFNKASPLEILRTELDRILKKLKGVNPEENMRHLILLKDIFQITGETYNLVYNCIPLGMIEKIRVRRRQDLGKTPVDKRV